MVEVGNLLARWVGVPLRSMGFPIVRVWTWKGGTVQVRVYREGNFLAYVYNAHAPPMEWLPENREWASATRLARGFWEEFGQGS